MKDTDLKHLTLKTAFLLALASFIAKKQLAREGSQSVSLCVTIPALTTIVDRQFKEDSTLCPVRALRYYLDRTKDLLRWGIGGPNHANLSLESSQHIYKFLPKRAFSPTW